MVGEPNVSESSPAARSRRCRSTTLPWTWCCRVCLCFHRRLRCLILIYLKLNKLTAGDVGQMHLYCNYAREHWTRPDENPPVGLILCAEHRAGVAKYALEGLPNKVLAAQYRTALPSEETLAAELERTRKVLEERGGATSRKRRE